MSSTLKTTRFSGTESEAEAEAKKLEIGKLIPGKGIYAGVVDIEGEKYNLFAAPRDLTEVSGKRILLSFDEAAEELTEKKSWYGHDGWDYGWDYYKGPEKRPTLKVLKGKVDHISNEFITLNGTWFIPTKDMLKTLYANKDKGAFEGTFETDKSFGDTHLYVSSSMHSHLPISWTVDFTDGCGKFGSPSRFLSPSRFSCRPCRLEALTS